ncbi:MAG: hypothetical protein QXY92_08910 [Archaeoglobaceae archaeon]
MVENINKLKCGSMFCKILLIFFIFFLSLSVSEGRVYTITFAGLNQSYPYFKAYDYNRDTSAPPNPPSESSPPSGSREFSDANYQRIWYRDGSMADPGYETHYFIFKLPVDAATDRVVVRWYGSAQDSNDLVRLFAFNFDTNSWTSTLTSIRGGPTWLNYTFTNPDPFISPSGYMHLAFVGDPEGFGDTNARPRTDYIELEVTVDDAYVQTACVQVVSENIRDWDGFFDTDTITTVARATTIGGSVIPWYYNFSYKVEWDYLESGTGYFGIGFLDSSGNALVSGSPISGGITDKWRVALKVVVRDAIVNGTPYTGNALCSESGPIASNVAITPSSYTLTLIGRMYYNGGADWIRVVWFVDRNSVTKPYPIPVVQKFIGNKASVTIWKYGIDDYCTDPNCHREGIYGNMSADTDWNGACIAVGTTTPYCSRSPSGACYGDPQGPHPGRHDCIYFSGYRVGPFIQMNIPDHALGFLAAIVINLIGGSLDAFMRATYYDQHEGPYGILSRDARCGPLNPSTEQALTHGVLGLFSDPKGGLGVVGFVGLIADNQHAIGIMMGHRYGIHPMVAVVSTIPSYPTTESGWRAYMDSWLYYLLTNAIYVVKVSGEELGVWNLRYPTQNDALNLSRAFNSFLTDFLPYTREVLWLVVNCGKAVSHPFIVSTYIQLKDTFEIAQRIRTNSTLNSVFVNLVGEIFNQLPSFIGPPDASSGLNYLFKSSVQLPVSEKQNFAYVVLQLLDQVTDVIVTLFREIPLMEISTRANPGWNFNWIAGCGEG